MSCQLALLHRIVTMKYCREERRLEVSRYATLQTGSDRYVNKQITAAEKSARHKVTQAGCDTIVAKLLPEGVPTVALEVFANELAIYVEGVVKSVESGAVPREVLQQVWEDVGQTGNAVVQSAPGRE